MIIHIVQPGETLQSIADLYQVPLSRLILENGITTPNQLALGQTIVILFPAQTYIVQEDDTLSSIAALFQVSEMTLLRNNIYLTERTSLIPGELIVISYTDEKIMPVTINGYAYTFINEIVLRKTLPYLTYLTIFHYQITYTGELIPIDDKPIIDIARSYGVSPVMLISPFTDKGYLDISIMIDILNHPEKQDLLIASVIDTLYRKGYDGVNIDLQYILPEDQLNFINFIELFTNAIRDEGFFVFNTISPSIFELNTGTIYSGKDYKTLGEITDGTTIIYYDWCCINSYPRGLASLESMQTYLEHMISQIDPTKISISISSIGYTWQLPFVEGITVANSISNPSAVELAKITESVILFDEATTNPYYSYTYINEYMVWFRDARSVDSSSILIPQYQLNGILIWNIMQFFYQAWLVLNSQFDIIKLHEEPENLL